MIALKAMAWVTNLVLRKAEVKNSSNLGVSKKLGIFRKTFGTETKKPIVATRDARTANLGIKTRGRFFRQ